MTDAERTEGAATGGTPSDGGELASRLGAIELRLRLLEVPAEEPAADPDDVESGEAAGSVVQESGVDASAPLLSPPRDVPAAARPLDEVAEERLAWADEAMVRLTEIIERLRATGVQQESRRREESLEAQRARTALEAALAVQEARTGRLEDALARSYADGQAAQGQAQMLKESRSYVWGRRISAPARWGGSHDEDVTAAPSFVVPGVDPADVTLVAGSGLFDSRWYEATYPDVASAAVDPFAHFMTRGGVEARCPGPYFDIGWYLTTYAAELPEGVNPLVFYLREGWRRGHRPSEGFDPEQFVRDNPVVAQLDLCPLVYLATVLDRRSDA